MKVLFFAYSFPPANLPASTRTWNMAVGMAEGGSMVNVVTLEPQAWIRGNAGRGALPTNVHRIEVPARRRYLVPWELRTAAYPGAGLVGGVRRRIARAMHVDPHSGWLTEAAKATRDLRAEDVDVILATGSPFGSFDLARRMGQRLGRPFILDYRDLWSHNPHTATVSAHREREILRDAAGVLAVSPSLLRVLDSAYGLEGRGHVLPNAFDENEMRSVSPARFDHFSIVYAGQFYPPKRTPKPLLAALARTRVPGWKFHYAGPDQKSVLDAADACGVRDRVVCYGNVSRQESLELTGGASLAVVMTSVDDEGDDSDRGILTSKLFDVLGLRRPLLAIAPAGADIRSLVHGRDATGCFRGSQTQAIAEWVEGIASGSEQAPPASEHTWRSRGADLQRILRQVGTR